ncbi:MAG: hypothetical protein AAGG81_06030 [Chlamydiota bacterium]
MIVASINLSEALKIFKIENSKPEDQRYKEIKMVCEIEINDVKFAKEKIVTSESENLLSTREIQKYCNQLFDEYLNPFLKTYEKLERKPELSFSVVIMACKRDLLDYSRSIWKKKSPNNWYLSLVNTTNVSLEVLNQSPNYIFLTDRGKHYDKELKSFIFTMDSSSKSEKKGAHVLRSIEIGSDPQEFIENLPDSHSYFDSLFGWFE